MWKPAYTWGFIALVTFVAATSAVAIGLPHWSDGAPSGVQMEVFKSLLQLTTVGVLGAVVALLLRLFEKGRETARADAEALRQRRASQSAAIRAFAVETLNTYNEIKLVRRLLRARSTPGPDAAYVLPAAQYEELFVRLERAQLDLELLKRKVELDRVLFEPLGGPKELLKNLKAAETYIGSVLREFEGGDHQAADGFRTLSKPQLAHAFITRPTKKADYPEVAGAQTFFRHMNKLQDDVIRLVGELNEDPRKAGAVRDGADVRDLGDRARKAR